MAYEGFGQSSFYHDARAPHQAGGASPPGQMDTSGYLPGFLLGPSSVPRSPSRSRSAPQPTQLSSAAVAPLGGPLPPTKSSMHVPGGTTHHHGMATGSVIESKPTTIGVGPPVQGLYEHPPSPARTSTPLTISGTPERRQLNFSTLNSATRLPPPQALTGTPSARTPAGTTPGAKLGTSPAQMDPFYTQGENLTSQDDYDDCWITVFGFPPAASSYILEQFSQYGTILDYKVTSCGNWMHILYQSKLQATKALSKNGKVFGNGIMVGVQRCIDKSVIEGRTMSDSTIGATRPPTPTFGGQRPASIRPLTAAYQAASASHQVVPTNPNTPQKSTGLFSKALEYIFGW
eukprot:Em0016g362a